MWTEQEWYDYLEANGGKEMRDKYHPKEEISNLEGLFA